MAHTNPTILPVGLAINDLEVGEPFIGQQVCELTGLRSTQVLRNLGNLRHAVMIEPLEPPDINHHLRPYARLEHRRWQFFGGLWSMLDVDTIDQLFGQSWSDVPGWLRDSHGRAVVSKDPLVRP
jgi:hypothetical protein